MTLAGIGTCWYGPRLGQMEQACLRSMLARGHRVVLFTSEKVDGVPAGVEICDVREIVGDRKMFPHRLSGSPALFSDLFRYHMLAQTDLIWADSDAFLLAPLVPKAGYLVGWEDKKRMNGAILALPHASPALRDLIAMCGIPYPCLIPPFVLRRPSLCSAFSRLVGHHPQPIPWEIPWDIHTPKLLYWFIRSNFKHSLGRPERVSQMVWGLWGPLVLGGFLKYNGEAHHALPPKCLYPIRYRQRKLFLAPAHHARALLSPDSQSVHLYGSTLRSMLGDEPPPAGSFLAELFASV